MQANLHLTAEFLFMTLLVVIKLISFANFISIYYGVSNLAVQRKGARLG